MSSLRERLLRHKRPGDSERDVPEHRAAGDAGETTDACSRSAEQAEDGIDAIRETEQLNPYEQEQDREAAEWAAIGAHMELSSDGAFVMRRRVYKQGYRHGAYTLSGLTEGAAALLALLGPVREMDSASNKLSGLGHEQLLFMDTETTGLGLGAGNVPFMIGIGYFEGPRFTVEQMLIRHPGEELTMLAVLQEHLRKRPYLISYNGKSFDWPLVKNRYILNRMALSAEPAGHLDFLYPSRSLWRRTLPSCRLGNVEEARLGVIREHDVPGSMAPALYFQYLAERDPAVLRGVFEHNELDVLSLAGLAAHFTGLLDGRIGWREASKFGREEWFRLGLWLDKLGKSELAKEALEALAEELLAEPVVSEEGIVLQTAMDECHLPLAKYFKQKRLYTTACALWRRYIEERGERPTASLEPYTELSMYYEHKEKQYDTALRYAQLALDKLWQRGALARSVNSRREGPAARAGLSKGAEEAAALKKRVERLQKKSFSASHRPGPLKSGLSAPKQPAALAPASSRSKRNSQRPSLEQPEQLLLLPME